MNQQPQALLSHRDAALTDSDPSNDRTPLVGRTGKVFESAGARSTTNNLRVLAGLMRDFHPVQTLEIGLAFGASAVTIATAHRAAGAPPRRQHVAIDPFQRTVWDDIGRVALEQADLDGYVDVREGYSSHVLPSLVHEGWSCDLAYIDGSHLFEDVFLDFYYVNVLLNPNGLILFDDSVDPHVRKVLRFIRTNFRETFVPEDLLRYRSSFRDRLRYRAGRCLNRLQLTAFRKVGPTRREWNAKFVRF